MLAVVDRLVRSDVASYNEIDLAGGTAEVVIAGGPPPEAGHFLTTNFLRSP